MAPGKLLAEWFWIDRWMGSSAFGLPIAVRGLYREMLTQAWLRGARLPNDHDQIRRFIGVTKAEWRASWPRVERFWRVEGESIVNDTQIEIYQEAVRRLTVNGRRAQAGAQARWKDSVSNAQAHAQVEPKQCPPVSVSVSGLRPKKEPSSADADYEAFRQAYPVSRRVGGKLARNAFRSALERTTVGVMLAALEQHKRSEQWQTPKLIPLMTTWLNQERWLQVLPEPKAEPVPYECPHDPHCFDGQFRCRQRTQLAEFRKAESA